MRVAVTGATGFVGTALVRRLVNQGHQVVALVRPGSRVPDIPEAVLETAEGDISTPETLVRAFTGRDAVIHLVGIIRETGSQTFERVHAEGSANVVSAASQCQVGRLVHMSALGVGETAQSRYYATKLQGETFVRNSGLDFVIMRPSLIVGRGDGFTSQLIDLARRAPVVPIIGSGKALMQPISVEDVTAAFDASLTGDEHRGQTYLLGGPDQIQFRHIVRQVVRQLGSHKPIVHIPMALAMPAVSTLGRLTDRLPVTPDQLIMLQHDNIAEPNHASTVFKLSLATFQDVLKRILTG